MGEITYREYEYECQARKHNFYLIVICNEHTNSLGGGRWLLMAANSVRIPSRLPTANVSTFRRVAIMPIKLCRGFVFFLQVFAFRYSHHHRCASCAVIWIASVFRVNGSVRFVRTDDSAPSPRVCVCVHFPLTDGGHAHNHSCTTVTWLLVLTSPLFSLFEITHEYDYIIRIANC